MAATRGQRIALVAGIFVLAGLGLDLLLSTVSYGEMLYVRDVTEPRHREVEGDTFVVHFAQSGRRSSLSGLFSWYVEEYHSQEYGLGVRGEFEVGVKMTRHEAGLLRGPKGADNASWFDGAPPPNK